MPSWLANSLIFLIALPCLGQWPWTFSNPMFVGMLSTVGFAYSNCSPSMPPTIIENPDGFASQYFGLSASTYFSGEVYTNSTGANQTLCRVDFALGVVNDVTSFSFTAEVTTLTGGCDIDTPIAYSDNAVVGTNSWFLTWVPFIFNSPPTLTNGERYAILIRKSDPVGGTNWVFTGNISAGAGTITNGYGQVWSQAGAAQRFCLDDGWECALRLYLQ